VNKGFGLVGCSLLILATLTACGGGGGDGSSTAAPPVNGKGSGSSPATPPSNRTASNNTMAGFLYVTHFFDLTMSAFTINATTGALSEVAGNPVVVDKNALPGPGYISVHPSGKFVYVVDGRGFTAEGPPQSGIVAAYAVDASTGALSEVAGSPFATGISPSCLKIDPSGKFAYVTHTISRDVSAYAINAYAINATTGALSEIAGSPFMAGNNPTASMAIHPSGKFAYLAHYGNPGTITGYAINATTGALTSIGVRAGAMSPGTIIVDPSGKFAYLTDGGSVPSPPGGILAYTINATTGLLSEVAGSPFATARSPNSIAVDPSGKFAYVTGYFNLDSVLAAFTINPTTGALSEISPYSVNFYAHSVTVDDSGGFVYVINTTDDSNAGIYGFSINTTTGALSSPRQFATFDHGVDVKYITANRRSQ